MVNRKVGGSAIPREENRDPRGKPAGPSGFHVAAFTWAAQYCGAADRITAPPPDEPRGGDRATRNDALPP